MKVAIIGVGNVGASIAYALTIKGTASDIYLIDMNLEKATGEALDLSHGASFVQATDINAADYSACTNADIIVITAGRNRKPGESRLDLIKNNSEVYKAVLDNILAFNPDPLLIIVSNPVDVLTYFTIKYAGLLPRRVIGSGTVLDSSRFRFLLSKDYQVDARNVHAYIIGEHGDSAVPVWSRTNVGGMPLLEYCHICKGPCRPEHRERIFREVQTAGREVIVRKGATYYAVALAVERIISAISRDEHSILTVSTLVEDYYDISDVSLSLPYIIGGTGIIRRLNLRINDQELNLLRESAKILRNYQKALLPV